MNRLGFTLVTYNCLAEIYATSEVYPYCPAWALPWNYRRRNILRELVAYHADIMCLQEVQARIASSQTACAHLSRRGECRRPGELLAPRGLGAALRALPEQRLSPRTQAVRPGGQRRAPTPNRLPPPFRMQADHYENFLEPELAKYNYAGLYKCKTREFMGQYGKMDGCAMFYRRDKFSILPGGAHDVEFNSIARMHAAPRRSNTRPAAT